MKKNAFKIAQIIPFIILFALLTLLFRQLFYTQQTELTSTLIGESVPTFQLPELFQPQKVFTEKDLMGKVALLNIWATWCYACRVEHPILMEISQTYNIPIYGINYKDDAGDAKNWLQQFGNPYTLVGEDFTGDVAIDFGIYGTPETFVISKEGVILYRHVGAVNERVWNDVLLPLIREYSND